MATGKNTESFSAQERQETLEYWTDERLRRAKPVESPTAPAETLRRIREEEESRQGSTDTAAPPADKAISTENPEKVDPNVRPFWNCGKFFFTQVNPSGGTQDYQGSAAFVGDPKVVMTAGHCASAGTSGRINTKFLFIRSAWSSIFGWVGQKVSFTHCAVPDEWSINGNYAYDYAFLQAHERSEAGWLGLDCRPQNSGIPCISVGYPQNYGNANDMYAVRGTADYDIEGIDRMPQNPFSHGCSGGPWIIYWSNQYAPDNNRAICLNSFGIAGYPGVWGPRFDGRTFDLFRATRDYQPPSAGDLHSAAGG
ncbi:hypothetical protein TR51_01760 [Kitasatospora griseola]|uniref:Peptidase n=1 Tax=Kitasatospora griseola TaxID=2064 RepID=A0A0D0Q1G2_KITGR|nr:hypothetical protein [Kitasatospora griseola]KIQ66382.1 hypothetical protein TR51_01760 [Kitasatospora griseola]